MPLGITPSGQRRLMQAQTPMPQEGQEATGLDMDGIDPQAFEQFQDNQEVDELENQVEEVKEEQSSSSPNLIKFIFDFMSEKLGYPPRRLQEFKSQFVHESGAKGQPSQYTITLPDQVYGSDEPIPDSMLKTLVNGIEQKFGISYQDYKRSDLKLILSFSSEDESAKEEMEEGPGDILDQVYKNKGGSSNSKKAQTIHEMIKTSKNHNLKNIFKLLGGE